jgi:hypothetical protein
VSPSSCARSMDGWGRVVALLREAFCGNSCQVSPWSCWPPQAPAWAPLRPLSGRHNSRHASTCRPSAFAAAEHGITARLGPRGQSQPVPADRMMPGDIAASQAPRLDALRLSMAALLCLDTARMQQRALGRELWNAAGLS